MFNKLIFHSGREHLKDMVLSRLSLSKLFYLHDLHCQNAFTNSALCAFILFTEKMIRDEFRNLPYKNRGKECPFSDANYFSHSKQPDHAGDRHKRQILQRFDVAEFFAVFSCNGISQTFEGNHHNICLDLKRHSYAYQDGSDDADEPLERIVGAINSTDDPDAEIGKIAENECQDDLTEIDGIIVFAQYKDLQHNGNAMNYYSPVTYGQVCKLR